MKHTTQKTIKFFALIMAFAALLNFLPIGIFVSSLVPSHAADISEHPFTPPTQSEAPFTLAPVAITNSNFSEGGSSSFTEGVSGWTAGETSANAVTGILNTAGGGFDSFKQSKHLEELDFLATNPLTDDDTYSQVLVMTNKTKSTSLVSYNSSSFTLASNSYYQISAAFYAVGSENIIALIPTDDTTVLKSNPFITAKQVSLTDRNGQDIPNASQWQTADFFVKTDMLSGAGFKLGLYLGSSKATAGVVYYDSVSVTQLNAKTFSERCEDAGIDAALPDNTDAHPLSRFVELDKVNEKEEVLANINFDDKDNTAFTPIKEENDSTQARSFVWLHDVPGVNHLNFENRTYLHGNGSIDNSGALLVSAVNSSQGIRLTEPLMIERQLVYMISFYTLSSEYSYMLITDSHIEDEDYGEKYPFRTAYNSDYFDIKRSTDGAAHNNNWTLNTVFLKGDAHYDTEVHIEFWMGGDNNNTGYLLVDDFSVQRVSNDYYTAHSSGTNATKKIINELTESEETAKAANGSFNAGTVRSASAPFPLTATGWTVNTEDTAKTFNGIVNTEADHWAVQSNRTEGTENGGNSWTGYGMASNPGAIPYSVLGGPQNENNNIYMMQNKEAAWQNLTTAAAFTIDRDLTYQISFDAATHITSGNEIKAWAVAQISGKEIARIPLGRTITSETERLSLWENHTFQIETSKFVSAEITLSFILGEESDLSAGVLFLDNVEVTSTGTKTPDTSASLKDTTKLARFEAGSDVGESLSFAEVDAAEDAPKAYAHFDKAADALELGTLGLQHVKIANTMTETTAAATYYKYVIDVTVDIQEHGSLANFDADGNKLEDFDYGVNFSLQNMENGFFNVKPAWLEDDGTGYTKLTFFIGAEEFPLALVVEFGSADVPVNASVGIKSSNLEEITKEAFDIEEARIEDTPYARMIKAAQAADEETEDDSGTDGSTTGGEYDFLIIPSIITALAIVLALVATLIRRMKFRVHIEKHGTSYARDDAAMKGKRNIKATESAEPRT